MAGESEPFQGSAQGFIQEKDLFESTHGFTEKNKCYINHFKILRIPGCCRKTDMHKSLHINCYTHSFADNPQKTVLNHI